MGKKEALATVAGMAMLGTGALAQSRAQAQEWDGMGEVLAAFYNETMSVPKGWELTYSGLKGGVEVFTFIVRPETVDVDTSWLDADDQMARVMCGDETPRGWIRAGMKVRADKVVIRGGKREVFKGKGLVTCG